MVALCISTRSTPQALIVMLEDLGLHGGVPSLSRNDSCVPAGTLTVVVYQVW